MIRKRRFQQAVDVRTFFKDSPSPWTFSSAFGIPPPLFSKAYIFLNDRKRVDNISFIDIEVMTCLYPSLVFNRISSTELMTCLYPGLVFNRISSTKMIKLIFTFF